MFRPITRRGLLSLTVDQQRCDNIGFISSKILSFWYFFLLFFFWGLHLFFFFWWIDVSARFWCTYLFFIFPKKIYLITNLYIYSPKASLRGNLEPLEPLMCLTCTELVQVSIINSFRWNLYPKPSKKKTQSTLVLFSHLLLDSYIRHGFFSFVNLCRDDKEPEICGGSIDSFSKTWWNYCCKSLYLIIL